MRDRPDIPASWWSGPASVTGGHHPAGQTNLSHALGVYRCARRAWRRVPWVEIRDSAERRRDFLLAAIYHDMGKLRDRDDHERQGADMAIERWPDRPLIAYLILAHSGRWGPTYGQRQRWLCWHQCLWLDTPKVRWVADLLAGCDYVDAYRDRIWPT